MEKYNTILEAVEALKKGKIIIVVDDVDRENEGDFICAGDFATPANINFMATYGKGLICTPINETIAHRFKLNPMIYENTDNHQTAFTISIDHRITETGISAYERSLTIKKMLDPKTKPEDFRRPGHVFPLIAKNNGVLERNGHTEATIDLLELSNLKPIGLCCEIMADDGHMMTTKELFKLAKSHKLIIITIKDLHTHLQWSKKLIQLKASPLLHTKYGDFRIYGYEDILTKKEHVALVMGNVKNRENVLCRVHSECLTGDTFGSLHCDCGPQFDAAMKMISENKNGILLYMRQEGRGIGLLNKLKAYELQAKGMDTIEANLLLGFKSDEREYYLCSQMLADLGVKSINLITNNPDKITKLKEYHTKINKRIPLQIKYNQHNHDYLNIKKNKMGHLLKK